MLPPSRCDDFSRRGRESESVKAIRTGAASAECFREWCVLQTRATFFSPFFFVRKKKSDNVTYCAVYCLLLSPLLFFFLETNKADRQAPIVAGGTISSSRIEKERENSADDRYEQYQRESVSTHRHTHSTRQSRGRTQTPRMLIQLTEDYYCWVRKGTFSQTANCLGHFED